MSDKKHISLEILWIRIIAAILILLIILAFSIFAPKRIFSVDKSTELAISMAVTSTESLLFYDYDVYGTEERFNDGLIQDIDIVESLFKERDEVLAVKIYGETDSMEIRNDYIFITSPDTPLLNIEYYLVQYMEFNDINIPCRTFIILFTDISRVINTVYIALYTIVTMSILIPTSISLTKNSKNLLAYYKSK